MLAVLFWSGNFILGSAVRLSVPPVGLAFWRWTGASLIIIGFAWPHLRQDWPILRRHWRLISLFALLGVAIFNAFAYTGLQYTSAINGVLLQSATPVLIVAVTYMIFRETISWRQGIVLLLTLIGVAVIVTQGELSRLRELTFNIGDVWILAAVLSWAIYSSLLRNRPSVHPLSFLAATFIIGAAALLPFYLWEHTTGYGMVFNRVTLMAVFYVVIFPSTLAYFFFNRGIELAGANRGGIMLNLMPVFGSMLAILLLGEQFLRYHAMGIALILAGILLTTMRVGFASDKSSTETSA